MSKDWKAALDRWLTTPPEYPLPPICEDCEIDKCETPCAKLEEYLVKIAEEDAKMTNQMYLDWIESKEYLRE